MSILKQSTGMLMLASLLGACAVQPSPDSTLTEKMIGQEWQLAKVSHHGLELKVDPAIAAFTLHISAEGQASGKVACNRWRGPATLEGRKLSISPAASTRARCNTSEAQHQELERRYLASLKGPLDWRVDGEQLILDISDNERWVYTWP